MADQGGLKMGGRLENIIYCFFKLFCNRRPLVAQGHKVWLYNRLVVGSIPTRGNEIFIYIFIFSFLRFGVKAKRGVDLRHSTRNASNTW